MVALDDIEVLLKLAKHYRFSAFVHTLLAEKLKKENELELTQNVFEFALRMGSREVLYQIVHNQQEGGGQEQDLTDAQDDLQQLYNQEIAGNAYVLEEEEQSGQQEDLSLILDKVKLSDKETQVSNSNNIKSFEDWMLVLDQSSSENQGLFYSAEAMAKKSEVDQSEMVSETLAQIYVQQGHYDKAIEYYQKLILLFPEKNDFFAGKIEKISQLKS